MFLFHIRRIPVVMVRRLGIGSNPLRRESDRVESAVLVLAMLGVVASMGIAGVVGASAYERGLRDTAGDLAVRRPVLAVLAETAPPGYGLQGGEFQSVRVSWKAPDGSGRTGIVKVSSGARAGTVVPIWTDRTGRMVSEPMDPGRAAVRAVLVGLETAGLGFAVVAGIFWLVRRRLDRERMAAWDREWARGAAKWTREWRRPAQSGDDESTA